MEHLRDRTHEQRLRQARRTGDQAMPAGEQRDEQLLDHLLLADDDLLQLGIDPRPALPNLLDDLLFHLVSINLRCHGYSCRRL